MVPQHILLTFQYGSKHRPNPRQLKVDLFEGFMIGEATWFGNVSQNHVQIWL